MKFSTLAAIGFAATAIAGSANAQSIQCGTEYTVVAGDYLSRIAKRAYNDPAAYTLLYSRNAKAIGSNPGRIYPGLVLSIPCLDDNTATKVARAEPTVSSTPTTGDQNYRIVVYGGWVPFLDSSEDDGGMLTLITRRSFEETASKPTVKFDFVSDPSFTLDPLIVDHAYDLTIGITKPDCGSLDELGEEAKFRCTALAWSDPIYEEVIAYYSLNGTERYNSHPEIFGKRVCRPHGFITAAMDKAGVKEPAVTMVRPAGPVDCIKALLDGEVDFAVLATDVAESAAKEVDAEDALQMQDALNHVSTVHTVTAIDHPQADEMLTVFNQGLSVLKESGEWFEIVRTKMLAHRQKS